MTRTIFTVLSVTGTLLFEASQAAWAAPSPSPAPLPQPTYSAAPASGSVCEHLSNADGKALYLFEKDTSSASNCNDTCAIDWPPALSPDFGSPAVVAPVKKELAGTPISRTDGKIQSIYGGHPLYIYKGDTALGDTKGQCTTAYGGKWYLVKSDGTACSCDTPAPPAPPSGGSSGCGPYGCGGGGSSSSSCGSYDVCGWTPGWRCSDPNPYLSQCRSECCEFKNDFSCKGSDFCGSGYGSGGGGSCTTSTSCGWTPKWRCYLPKNGCAPFDRSCLSQCGCYDAGDSSCGGY